MSTRSIIGVYDNKRRGEWHGVYHHFDGYPEGLGSQLLELGKTKGYDFIKQDIIGKHPNGWSTIIGNWKYKPVNMRTYREPKKYNPETARPKYYPKTDGQDMTADQTSPVGTMGSEYLYLVSRAGLDIFQAFYNEGEFAGSRMIGFFGMGAPDIGKGEQVIWRRVGRLKWSDSESKIDRLVKRLNKEAA